MGTEAAKLTLVDRFQQFLQVNGTTIRIRKKSDSLLMTILGKLLFFNKSFMKKYYTTMGGTIYTPTEGYDPDSQRTMNVIAHEVVHIGMSKAHPILYALTYLYPQCLAVFALLALLPFEGFLWCLLALLFFLPWPAPGRSEIEKWGYLMSLITGEWSTGKSSSFDLEFVLDQFDGSAYYWMRRGGRLELRKWFVNELSKLRAPMYPAPIFKQVFTFMKQEKAVHPSYLMRSL